MGVVVGGGGYLFFKESNWTITLKGWVREGKSPSECRFFCKQLVQMGTFGGYFKQTISPMLTPYPLQIVLYFSTFQKLPHARAYVRMSVYAPVCNN